MAYSQISVIDKLRVYSSQLVYSTVQMQIPHNITLQKFMLLRVKEPSIECCHMKRSTTPINKMKQGFQTRPNNTCVRKETLMESMSNILLDRVKTILVSIQSM